MYVWVRGWNGHCCPAPLQQVRKPSCSRQSWKLTNPEGSEAQLGSLSASLQPRQKLGTALNSSGESAPLTLCAQPPISAVTLQARKVF